MYHQLVNRDSPSAPESSSLIVITAQVVTTATGPSGTSVTTAPTTSTSTVEPKATSAPSAPSSSLSSSSSVSSTTIPAASSVLSNQVSALASTTPTSTAAANATHAASHGNLSHGTQIGIGIGSAIGAAAVIGIIVFLLFRRTSTRRSRAAENGDFSSRDQDDLERQHPVHQIDFSQSQNGSPQHEVFRSNFSHLATMAYLTNKPLQTLPVQKNSTVNLPSPHFQQYSPTTHAKLLLATPTEVPWISPAPWPRLQFPTMRRLPSQRPQLTNTLPSTPCQASRPPSPST